MSGICERRRFGETLSTGMGRHKTRAQKALIGCRHGSSQIQNVINKSMDQHAVIRVHTNFSVKELPFKAKSNILWFIGVVI